MKTKKLFEKENKPYLKKGDKVIVDGEYNPNDGERTITFKMAFGVILEDEPEVNKDWYLIKFQNWYDGSSGWKHPKCGRYDCFYLPKENNNYFSGTIFKADLDVESVFKSINENDDENWWQEIVQRNPDTKIELNYYQDLHDKKILNQGDNINILIDQDGLYINGDAVVIRQSELGGDLYLIRLPEVLYIHDDPIEGSTHCGQIVGKDDVICGCVDSDDDVGKCWFVNLSHAEELYIYPYRKGFNFL